MRGALLGTMIGDAVGSPFEGRFEGVEGIVRSEAAGESQIAQAKRALALVLAANPTLRYTDDTQMAIALAESIAELGEVDPNRLALHFASRYDPARCYGPGAAQVLERIGAGDDWALAARSVFTDGSWGNGAAMRVAPVGAFHHDRPERLHPAAELSAVVTHLHPLGIAGAAVMAQAVSLAMTAGLTGVPLEVTYFERALIARLMAGGSGMEIVDEVDVACDLVRRGEPITRIREVVGNGVEARQAVAAAIGAFLAGGGDVEATLGLALMIGGDTDTIGAMAGALVGAFRGEEHLPAAALTALAGEEVGVDDVRALADRLFERWCADEDAPARSAGG
jgi:poly(ADP-ribose) glycohydrolase ARH3